MKNVEKDAKYLAKLIVKAIIPKTTRQLIRSQQNKIKNIKNRLVFKHHLRPTDVFLVGHPKSGNTWMAYVLAIIINKDYENRITIANIGKYVPVVHGEEHLIANYPHLTEPRIFRNEWPAYTKLYPKIIYLVRDPRAVLISLYHMYCTVYNDYRMSLHAFLEEYLLHGCIRKWEPDLIRWDKQVLAWTNLAENDENIMIVKYEDMVNNLRFALERVAKFVGISFDGEILTLAEERGTFKAMRMNEEKHGAESYLHLGEQGRKAEFIRSGKVDGWKKEMPQNLVDQIENEFAPVMRVMGYLT